MKNKYIKIKILVSMITVALFCCAMLLLFLGITHKSSVQRFIYESIDNKKDSIDLWISSIYQSAFVAANNLADYDEFKNALIAGNSDVLITFVDTIDKQLLDYGTITDKDGNILLRTHEINNKSGNIAHLEQIQLALSGTVNSSVNRGEKENLRVSTTVPVFGDNNNLIGTITLGRSLDNSHLAYSIKTLIDCEITFFDGSDRISSTMHFSSLTLFSDEVRREIDQTVLKNGGIFRDDLNFVSISILAAIYPLYDINNDITGMILVGINSDKVFTEVLNFILIGLIITLVVMAVVIFVALYISSNTNKQFTTMVDIMTHRELLLKAVNNASVILLEIDDTDEIKEQLVSSMVIIGNAMDCDHVHLWQARTVEDNCTRFVRDYSWVSNYAKARTKTPKHITVSNDSSKLDWMEKFLKEEYISGIIPKMDAGYQEHLKPLHTKSITMIPIFLENQFWGMFSIDYINKETVFDDEEIAIFRSVSLMMANIVRRHALQRENLKVYTDALTGIHNRRYFDKSMIRIISSLSRTGGELSVMMIDIDYFKKYNDTYGHGPGDECLIRVAEILSDSVHRVDDFVARYGGEEFVAVLPNTGIEGAVSVAQKMLDNIKTAAIEHKASEVAKHVSFSIGITTGVVTKHHTSETFLQRADEMLYKSKNDGRNRYTLGQLESSDED